MSLLAKIQRLLKDPPPEFAFELSEAGVSWVRTGQPAAMQWKPLPPGVVTVSPLEPNILDAELLHAAIAAVEPVNGKQRTAAVILPDYCARVGVLDFDTFPQEPLEQGELVRFRVKRALALDVESAKLSWYPQHRASNSAKHEVIIAAIAPEIAQQYEAPFRAAGYHAGFITLSALAALPLGPAMEDAASIVVKLTGRVVAVTVIQAGIIKLFRCVQLTHANASELSDILLPTIAYMEDQLSVKPQHIKICGFEGAADVAAALTAELGVDVVVAASRFGAPGPYNSGLFGYLETIDA